MALDSSTYQSVNTPTNYSYNPVRSLMQRFPAQVFALMIIHVILAFAMRQTSIVSTFHALFVLVLGLFFLAVDSKPNRISYLVAYSTGSELLWRMTRASVFWEYGKYVIILFLILALIKFDFIPRSNKLPLAYFVLLIPSIFLLPNFDREVIAFNLSGPLALVLSVMYFSVISIDKDQFNRIIFSFLIPITGISVLVASSTITAELLIFSGGSNDVTSGGFGPNQVSSILGLGVLLSLLYVFSEERSKILRLFVFIIGIVLAMQSALTFSRGGLLSAFGALFVAMIFLFRNRQSRFVLMLGSAIFLIITVSWIIPWLDNFTEGAIVARFTDLETSGRDLILQADFLAFLDNPVFGVGPGASRYYHALLFRSARAHTEFSRMLAEHGLFGLGSLIMLFFMIFQQLRTYESPLTKAIGYSFITWSFLFMFHAGMRLAAPSFMIGLAFTQFRTSTGENIIKSDLDKEDMTLSEFGAEISND